MNRGEVWTVRDDLFASKARPAVVIQSDQLRAESVIVAMTTTEQNESIIQRIKLNPSAENGLRNISYVMADKPATLPKKLIGYQIGKLDDVAMREISRALASALGITASDLG